MRNYQLLLCKWLAVRFVRTSQRPSLKANPQSGSVLLGQPRNEGGIRYDGIVNIQKGEDTEFDQVVYCNQCGHVDSYPRGEEIAFHVVVPHLQITTLFVGY